MLPHSHNCEGSSYSGSNSSRHRGSVQKLTDTFCEDLWCFKWTIGSFGDNLHKIHPFAGQGLNMTIRDTKILSDLIDFRINLGLQIDSSISKEFQNKTKHYNYIFSGTLDFIHDFFKFDNNFGNTHTSKLFNFLETNSFFKRYTKKFADKGIF